MMHEKNPHNPYLLQVLDYILHHATAKDLDVVEAALIRRQKLLHTMPSPASIQPEKIARQMSESIYESIDTSMESVRTTFRSYAEDLLKKENQSLSDSTIAALVNSWIPSSAEQQSLPSQNTINHNGKINGIPVSLLYEMIVQFVSYGIGEMTETQYKALSAVMPHWTTQYWKIFPHSIQKEIKTFLGGNSTSGCFQKNISVLLGKNNT